MNVEPQKEHHWLQRLVGEWTFEFEAEMPGAPPSRHTGTESVRSLGGVWTVGEAHEETTDGRGHTSIMTLGYDPARQRYVGSFVGSMMTYLWIYDGELDAEGKVLTLYAEGPSFTAEGEMGKYRDAIELRSDDHRVMTSSFLGENGRWSEFMTSHYRRVK
jgi:hypothetical protein